MPLEHFWMLFFTGIFGWLAQEGISIALNLEKAGRAAILNYLQIVICFIFDVAILKRAVLWTDVLGTVCIVGFTLFSSLKKIKKP